MIGYVTLGTNDIDKSTAFYDELLSEIEAKRIMTDAHIRIWSTAPGAAMLSVIKPYNGEAATVGNGTMVALAVDTAENVAKLHAKALALGGQDEGAPGPRGDGKMIFGYCRDLEGNKLAFYCRA
ncbi:VOC family protein [Sneathiella marina]|uniref:VOC family protein n=1 Tax=Sneathiella marina TaxID=2950108 RepID=A0ABY4VZ95_9PROT|nr:VOC family protein [Sneathiella marina]USG60195.1 VOC family protein [Sneathiella marina]